MAWADAKLVVKILQLVPILVDGRTTDIGWLAAARKGYIFGDYVSDKPALSDLPKACDCIGDRQHSHCGVTRRQEPKED